MNPNSNEIRSLYREPSNQKKPRFGTEEILIAIVAVLIIAGGTWYLFAGSKNNSGSAPESQIGVNTPAEQNWKTYKNDKYGFEINYPSDFVFQENPDGVALVGFYYPQSLTYEGVGTKIYVKHSDFTSFDDFASDMKEDYIFRLVKGNSLSDEEAREETKKYEGRYSFEVKKVNNTDMLIHKRDFFGYIDGVFEAYIWIGGGDYLLVYGSDLNLDSFKFISTTQN